MALLPLENAKPKAKANAKATHTSTRGIISTREKLLITKKRPSPPPPTYKSKSRRNQDHTMEEMMMVMMKIRGREISDHHHSSNIINIPSPSCPTWKLYENPFYISHNNTNQKPNQLLQNTQKQDSADHHNQKQVHRLHLPVSTRKIAASFWDLTFIKPLMESELEMTRSHIEELKEELEAERKARKRMESLNKRLASQLSEERKAREALERVCQELAKENSSDKAEINRIKREMAEERKMLRVAEVIREERVQMKLADAKILMEEQLSQLEKAKERGSGLMNVEKNETKIEEMVNDHDKDYKRSFSFRERVRFVLGEKVPDNAGNVQSMALMQRKASVPEAENPHIKRGIKGFVEFPKVVRAIGCRSDKHLGSKLECQKAQLKILLKQKGSVRFNGLIAG